MCQKNPLTSKRAKTEHYNMAIQMVPCTIIFTTPYAGLPKNQKGPGKGPPHPQVLFVNPKNITKTKMFPNTQCYGQKLWYLPLNHTSLAQNISEIKTDILTSNIQYSRDPRGPAPLHGNWAPPKTKSARILPQKGPAQPKAWQNQRTAKLATHLITELFTKIKGKAGKAKPQKQDLHNLDMYRV